MDHGTMGMVRRRLSEKSIGLNRAEATVEYGPLQTLVNVIIYARGLYGETLVNMCDSFIHFTRPLHFVA
jgi:hypothetical protein